MNPYFTLEEKITDDNQQQGASIAVTDAAAQPPFSSTCLVYLSATTIGYNMTLGAKADDSRSRAGCFAPVALSRLT